MALLNVSRRCIQLYMNLIGLTYGTLIFYALIYYLPMCISTGFLIFYFYTIILFYFLIKELSCLMPLSPLLNNFHSRKDTNISSVTQSQATLLWYLFLFYFLSLSLFHYRLFSFTNKKKYKDKK